MAKKIVLFILMVLAGSVCLNANEYWVRFISLVFVETFAMFYGAMINE